MKRKGPPALELYRIWVSKEGLFGKAFFGHSKTRKEARRLKSLWKKAMFESGDPEEVKAAHAEWDKNGTQAGKPGRVHRAGTGEGTPASGDDIGEGAEGTA